MSDRKTELVDLEVIVAFEAPFPTDNLEESLDSRGYQVERSGRNLAGRRDGVVYFYNRDEGSLTVGIDDVNGLGETVEELREVVADVEVAAKHVAFVQLLVEELVWAGSDTTEVFASHVPAIELGDEFTREPKPAGLNFVSHSSIQNRSDYFNLRVESYARNTDYYYVELLYRKPDFEEVAPMCRGLQEQIDAVISTIEGSDDG